MNNAERAEKPLFVCTISDAEDGFGAHSTRRTITTARILTNLDENLVMKSR